MRKAVSSDTGFDAAEPIAARSITPVCKKRQIADMLVAFEKQPFTVLGVKLDSCS
jgi:hypothetical protein